MMKLLKNVTYLNKSFNLASGDILIEGEHVTRIDEKIDHLSKDYQETDCSGLLLIPGLVNAHFHSGSNSARGLSQEMGIFDWGNESDQGKVQNILYDNVDKHLTDNEYEVIVLMGFIELIKQGVTSVIDSGFALRNPRVTANAIKKIGLRAILDTYDKYASFKDKKTSMLQYACHLDEEEDLSIDTVDKAKEKLRKYRPIFVSHSMENSQRKELVYKKFGKSSVAVYEESGLLSENVIFFHGTMLSHEDIIRLKDKNVHLVHCPESNLTTSSGIAPIGQCLREGVNVCLGTDWANTRYWEMMRLSYQLLKTNSATDEFNAKTILKMATHNGFKSMSQNFTNDFSIGSLADITFIDMTSPSMLPLIRTHSFNNYCHNILTNIDEPQIKHVMINGEWVLKRGVLKTVDENKISKDYKNILEKVFIPLYEK